MKNLTIILFCLLQGILFAQPEENANSNEYDQILGKTYTQTARWQAFERSRLATLENPNPVPMPAWETLGPNTLDTLSGRMICLTFDPTDSDILYAGAGSGGLWKSTNGGDSWFPLTDVLPSMHVSAIAVNPQNTQEILIGTGIGKVLTTTLQPGVGVLKSTDGGLTWNPTSYQYPISAVESSYELIWDESLSGKVLLAATNGLYESTDGGDNWTALLPNVRIYDIEINKQNPQIIYVGVLNQGVRRSTNGGQSWTTLNNGIPSGSSVFRSNLAICDSQPDILYASLVSSTGFGAIGLYKTTNGGDTWIRLTNAPSVQCQPNNPANCAGWLFNTVGVSPDNPDLVMMGGVQFWRSTNGGQTWTWQDYLSNGSGGGNIGLTYVDHWDIEFDPENASTVYVCSDGGVQKSTNSGQFWVRKSMGLINAQVYSTATQLDDRDFMIGGFHDHGLQRLFNTNENTTWTRWSQNDGIATVISHDNPNVLYGNIQNGTPYKSTTQGSSTLTTFPIANGINEPSSWITPLLQDPRFGLQLYTSSNNFIYKTTNGGNLWQTIHNLAGNKHLAINHLNPDTVYAHTFTNAGTWQLWRSHDAGTNWSQINHTSIPSWGVTAIEGSPHDALTLYATRNSANPNNDHVKVSYDNGATWTNITNNLPDIKVFDILVSPLTPNHIYLGTALGVYVSTDAGDTWEEWNSGMPIIETYDVDYSPADSTIRIATMGRGIWKSPALLPESVSTDDWAEWAAAIDFQVYPNPSSGRVRARFNLPENGAVLLELLDVRGQAIQTQKQEMFAGQQEIELAIANGINQPLPSGIYFLRLVTNGKAMSRKIVVE